MKEPGKTPPSILLVLDNALISADLEMYLENLGYKVRGNLSSGESALAVAERDRPDLVLMSQDLSGRLDGFETADLLRRQWDIPVVFITPYADDERLSKAKTILPFGYILLPFREREIKVAVEMALYVSKIDRERRQAEIALRQSEEKFSKVFQDGPISVAISTLEEGRFLEVNEAFERLTGYSKEELVGRTSSELNIWHDPLDRERLIESLVRSGRILDFEARFRCKSGEIKNGLMSATTLVLDSQPRLLTTVLDITDRKSGEEELTNRQIQFKTVMDSLDAMVYVADMDTYEVLFLNKFGRDIFGDITGQICWQSLQSGMSGPCDFCTNGKLLDADGNSTGVYLWEFQNTIDGRWYMIRDRAIPWIDGRLVRLEIATDITDRKQAEHKLLFEVNQRKQAEAQLKILVDQLERANQELENFAYMVSHDLKAPLRGLSSLASWLEEDYSGQLDDQGREYLADLTGRTRIMHNFIDGILKYSRVGRTKPDLGRVESGEVVREIINNLEIPNNIKVMVEEPLPTVIYDRIHLGQIFQNLIENAVKHMGDTGDSITISGLEKDEVFEFCVRDNGVGIEERHFERIFRIFHTLKPRDETESTGIGLSLVKRIAERYDGSVRVESEVGRGSAFYFTIPRDTKIDGPDAGSRVLIIDNNEDFAGIAIKMLEGRGYRAAHALNGHQALEFMKTEAEPPEIILLDIDLPGDDALQIPRSIKALRPEVRIIVCADGSRSDKIEALREAGVEGVLNKPFHFEEFQHILETPPSEGHLKTEASGDER